MESVVGYRRKCNGSFLISVEFLKIVDPDILLNKLECYGTKGNALKWIQKYDTQRIESI